MTMLDRMRRHKNWLKWSLLVCLTLSCSTSQLPGTNAALTGGDTLASVDSKTITVAEYRRRYLAQVNAYRASYGGNVTDALLQQMQVPQTVLQQMIQENAEIGEAERLGIVVSDAEVRAQVLAIPGLQENGHFIGEDRYRQVLRAQDPPMTPADFEQAVRQSLLIDKLRAGTTEWMAISDAELEREYKHRNEKVTLNVVSILADNFKKEINPSDADSSAHFDASKEQYRVPEQRKVKVVRFVNTDAATKITVPRADVEKYYSEHLGQ